MPVPKSRIRRVNDAPIRADRDYVLHWMTGFRRIDQNFAIDRAIEHALELDKPLIVFEALRAGYTWASDRLHAFVIDGMRDNQARLADTPIGYFPYLEPKHGDGKGLLEELAAKACVVTTDDFPTFFLPNMLSAAADKLDVCLEAIDGNGLLPLRATDRIFERAQDFRRYMQKTIAAELEHRPSKRHTATRKATLPKLKHHKPTDLETVDLSTFAIDHTVPEAFKGGPKEALKTAKAFIRNKLRMYGEGRNHPDDDAASGLSPFLHWGHIGIHQVFDLLESHEEWTTAKLAKPNGKREGFWKMSPNAESFLDEIITWRELSYNTAALKPDYETYDTLPEWCRKTLAKHASDPREKRYSLEQLESAKTYDEVWNAAQRQMLRDGRMHNYLRMLWGKKVLEWSDTPQQALETLLHLNNKYCLDGRNPNSTSGVFWVFGRYDRPWGPERPIFGTIRYMSSAATIRKLRMADYLTEFGARPALR